MQLKEHSTESMSLLVFQTYSVSVTCKYEQCIFKQQSNENDLIAAKSFLKICRCNVKSSGERSFEGHVDYLRKTNN